ncbi:hypothetical protein JXA02_07090 [candidate division KSB1 bacterium]|nr:hypothetical protein [candidate division KSB1 bacterium]RQW06661.1 MAG: hypothetical protein EH222_08265 [candidate division KSB1 bacterium]
MNENHENREKARRAFAKIIFAAGAFIIIVLAELLFDIVEIGTGRLLLLSNPIRPQTGRLWEEDHKEQIGLDELDSAQVVTLPANAGQSINSLEDLEAVLSIHHSMSMTREEFNEFYRTVPQNLSEQIIQPLDLFTMNRSTEWHKTQLSLSGDQLVFHFLDGYEKPIRESHLALRPEEADTIFLPEMEQREKFRGRLLPAALFYRAFDQLPRAYQVQIVNDPYKLVQWQNSLQRVGISLWIEDGGVEIIFEVSSDARVKLHSMYASEMAVGYLIREINSIEDAPKLQDPYRREDDAEEDH